MLIPFDPKNTCSLVGAFIVYHNRIKYICQRTYGGIKNAPAELSSELLEYKSIRDNLAHELWEIIHDQIIAVNNGEPRWLYSREYLAKVIEQMNDCAHKIGSQSSRGLDQK